MIRLRDREWFVNSRWFFGILVFVVSASIILSSISIGKVLESQSQACRRGNDVRLANRTQNEVLRNLIIGIEHLERPGANNNPLNIQFDKALKKLDQSDQTQQDAHC